MTSHLTQEMDRVFALSKKLCEGNELAFDESYELENGTTVMFMVHDLHQYMVTLEGEGEDMIFCVRSIDIPELYLRLPPPAYVRFGEPPVLEDFC